MRKIYMAGVSAVALTAIASPALSQSPAPEIPAGLYLAAGAGFSLGFERDFDHDGVCPPCPGTDTPDVPNPFFAADQDFSTGPIFEGAIGYDFGPSIRLAKLSERAHGARVEFQASFIDFDVNDIDPVVTSGSGPPGVRAGHLDVTLLMVNLLLDIDTGSPVTPYVGAGVGAALSTIDAGNPQKEGPPWVTFDDASDTGVVWQIIAGASVAVAPNLDLYGNYRLIGLPHMNADAVHPPEKDVDFDSQLAHTFTFGMRYTFGP